jgi:hypothetical protein
LCAHQPTRHFPLIIIFIIIIIMKIIIVTIIACAVFDKSKPGGRFLPNPSWSALLSTGGARTIGPASLEFVGQRGKTAGMWYVRL